MTKRTYGVSRTVESCPALDVRHWPRGMRLGPPLPATEQTVALPFASGLHSITVVWERCGSDWRRWLQCPGCRTRRATLYLHRGILRCRVCHGLRYYTQTVTRTERLRLKFVRWRERQGVSGALSAPYRERRRGEHHQHYTREWLHDSRLRILANEAWLKVGVRFLRR